MLKKHHILLVVAVVIAAATCLASMSEARGFRTYSTSTIRVLKPGARPYAGEPDDGNGKTGNNSSGGIVVPSPSGFAYILPAWVTRFVGAAW